MAIDYGTKNIGVAIGDSFFKIAFPNCIIQTKNPETSARKIEEKFKELECDKILFGLPLNMKEHHAKNKVQKEINKVIHILKTEYKLKNITQIDERLSTFEGNKLVNDIKQKGGKMKITRDAHSAQIILQRYFEKIA